MNHTQYIEALQSCFQLEAAGAIAGEVAMHLRTNSKEKQKLDFYRSLEASNRILCERALEQEQIVKPALESAYYRNAIRLGQKLGSGDWGDFLDRFEPTVYPEFFSKFVFDASGEELVHSYSQVDRNFFKHLLLHERALERFVQMERNGLAEHSTEMMEELLNSSLCKGLFSPGEPVGW